MDVNKRFDVNYNGRLLPIIKKEQEVIVRQEKKYIYHLFKKKTIRKTKKIKQKEKIQL